MWCQGEKTLYVNQITFWDTLILNNLDTFDKI
jgi:hypothetical protein